MQRAAKKPKAKEDDLTPEEIADKRILRGKSSWKNKGKYFKGITQRTR